MILSVLKNNKLARITTMITSFTIIVCLIVGFMIIKLSNKIQETKVSIRQNSYNAYEIEKLLEQYQQVEVKTLAQVDTTKTVLQKENIVDLIEIMEKTALENKVLPYVQIEGGEDLAKLSKELIYNIRFQAKENKMQAYLSALENLPYVSQIIQFQSSFGMNNNELIDLSEEEVNNKIQERLENSDQSYALRLKFYLK